MPQGWFFLPIQTNLQRQILAVSEADLWAMDAAQENVDEIRPLPDNSLYQVRGVEGVQWAVRLYKGVVRVRTRSVSKSTPSAYSSMKSRRLSRPA